jgi:hypothetical protein
MTKRRLGDAPIQPEYVVKMNRMAGALDYVFNGGAKGNARKTGFVLMVFPFAEFAAGDSRCNYISNGADRKDVVTLMREMIARFERQPEQKGSA